MDNAEATAICNALASEPRTNSRDSAWWSRHYRALAMNPARESSETGRYRDNMRAARRHLSSFVERQGIKLDAIEAMEWESELLAFLNPELRRRAA